MSNWRNFNNIVDINDLNEGDKVHYVNNNDEEKWGGEIVEIPNHKKSIRIQNKYGEYWLSLSKVKEFYKFN